MNASRGIRRQNCYLCARVYIMLAVDGFVLLRQTKVCWFIDVDLYTLKVVVLAQLYRDLSFRDLSSFFIYSCSLFGKVEGRGQFTSNLVQVNFTFKYLYFFNLFKPVIFRHNFLLGDQMNSVAYSIYR